VHFHPKTQALSVFEAQSMKSTMWLTKERNPMIVSIDKIKAFDINSHL
jgi:hypothetical protein